MFFIMHNMFLTLLWSICIWDVLELTCRDIYHGKKGYVVVSVGLPA